MTKSYRIVINQKPYTVEIEDLSRRPVRVTVNGEPYQVEWEGTSQSAPAAPPHELAPASSAPSSTTPPVLQPKDGDRSLLAPMPGKVLRLKCKVGDPVKRGDIVCVVESMKMETEIPAHQSGVVSAIRVSVGEMVGHGSILVEIT